MPVLNSELLPARAILERYSISDMTLWRWLHDEQMDFPRPMVVNRRRYFDATAISNWEAKRRPNFCSTKMTSELEEVD